MDITSLSTEILEHISAFVDRPGDLLALALTCHTFADIVIPNHLEYSYIRTDAVRLGIWSHLIKNPHLAARVHTLEIVDEICAFPFYPVVPKALWKPRGPEWFRIRDATPLVCCAIAGMTNLKTFRWLYTEPTGFTLDIVAAACRQLSGLEVISKIPFEDRMLFDKWCKFRNLKQFSYSGGLVKWDVPNSDMDVSHKRLTAFQQLLQRQCPYLEDLQLDFLEDVRANSLITLFQDHHWANLRRLNIQASILHLLDHEGRKMVIIPDLYNLETLRLTKVQGYVVVFSTILKLRSLEMDDLQDIPEFIAENLKSLSLTIPESESDEDDPGDLFTRLAPILNKCSNLRRLVIDSYLPFEDALSCILRACPTTLERLAYDGPPSFIDTNELAEVKGRMCNLTHIAVIHIAACKNIKTRPTEVWHKCNYGIIGLLGPINVRRFLAASAPRLKFIGWQLSDGVPFWNKLERDEFGMFKELRVLDEKSYQDDIVFENWGGHYRGASRVRLNLD